MTERPEGEDHDIEKRDELEQDESRAEDARPEVPAEDEESGVIRESGEGPGGQFE